MNPYDLPIDRRKPEPFSEGPKPDPFQKPTPPPNSIAAAHSRRTLLSVPVTPEAVLQWFIDNDGLAEQPDGSNHVPGVTDWWGLGNVPWCAESVSVALIKAGFGSWEEERLDMPGVWTRYPYGWAYCPDIVQAFQDAGRWHTADPEYGDIVLFDWDGDGWADHVGVFERDLGDGTCLTREGNADNRVTQKRRDYSDILGFARPPYATSEEDDLKQDEHDALIFCGQFLEELKQGRWVPTWATDIENRLVALEGKTSGAVTTGRLQVSGVIEVKDTE